MLPRVEAWHPPSETDAAAHGRRRDVFLVGVGGGPAEQFLGSVRRERDAFGHGGSPVGMREGGQGRFPTGITPASRKGGTPFTPGCDTRWGVVSLGIVENERLTMPVRRVDRLRRCRAEFGRSGPPSGMGPKWPPPAPPPKKEAAGAASVAQEWGGMMGRLPPYLRARKPRQRASQRPRRVESPPEVWD